MAHSVSEVCKPLCQDEPVIRDGIPYVVLSKRQLQVPRSARLELLSKGVEGPGTEPSR